MPLRGIKNDLHGRLACYKQDWTGGFRAGIRYGLKSLNANLIFVRNLGIVLLTIRNLASAWCKNLETLCDWDSDNLLAVSEFCSFFKLNFVLGPKILKRSGFCCVSGSWRRPPTYSSRPRYR